MLLDRRQEQVGRKIDGGDGSQEGIRAIDQGLVP